MSFPNSVWTSDAIFFRVRALGWAGGKILRGDSKEIGDTLPPALSRPAAQDECGVGGIWCEFLNFQKFE